MFGFFKRASGKKRTGAAWRRAVGARNRGAYKLVDGFTQNQVAPSSVETQAEDQILNANRRGRLLSLTRNLVRNSSLFSTILLQLESNVVGTCGGKVILNGFADRAAAERLRALFAAWTRNADFFDGNGFNHLLKVFLKQLIIGGDLVVVFDHFVEGSGKLLYFEADEVASVSPEVLERHYGKGATQSLGRVYSASGRWIGTVVSKSARGLDVADEAQCWFLKRDPDGSPLGEFWCQPSTAWRRSSRGVSRAATAVNTATQLEDLVLSELEASRKNAQTFCWLQSDADDRDEDAPSAFGNDADGDRVDVDAMTDEQVEKAVRDKEEERRIVLKEAHENAVSFQQLPAGFKATQLDTKHPNTNVETMTQYLSGRVAAVLGLSRAFATGNPTNDDFRAQQLLTAPAIVQYQKDLERICDWAFANFVRWAAARGLVDSAALPDDFTGLVSWEWKRLDSCDESATEAANFQKLKNLTGSYREILGNDWREKLTQVAEEVRWMRENGMTHPSALMLSGGETTAEKKSADAPKKTEEGDDDEDGQI